MYDKLNIFYKFLTLMIVIDIDHSVSPDIIAPRFSTFLFLRAATA